MKKRGNMEESGETAGGRGVGSREWLIFGIGFLLLLGFVRTGSIWIDEGQTWNLLRAGSWGEMFDIFRNSGNAVCGMPLFFGLEYLWSRFTGDGAWAMRSLNLVFGGVYLFAAIRLLRHWRIPVGFALLFILHPIFPYYMNEARPYIMLATYGILILWLLSSFDFNSKRTILCFHLAFAAGFASHVLFGFIGVLYAAFALQSILRREFCWRRHLAFAGVFALLYIPLAGFYLRIFTGGAPELNNELGSSPLKSLTQMAYSFTGFSGLGLSRNDLRGCEWSHFTPVMGILCAALVSAWAALLVAMWRCRERLPLKIRGLLGGGGLAMLLILAFSFLGKARFWERHIIWLLPVFIFLFLFFLLPVLRSGKRWLWIPGAAVILLTVLSGLRTAYLPYYEKDNYAAAARLALSLPERELLLYQGDRITFEYYGLFGEQYEKIDRENPPAVIQISNIRPEDLTELLNRGQKTVVILKNKPEFDRHHLWDTLKGKREHRFNVFKVIEL